MELWQVLFAFWRTGSKWASSIYSCSMLRSGVGRREVKEEETRHHLPILANRCNLMLVKECDVELLSCFLWIILDCAVKRNIKSRLKSSKPLRMISRMIEDMAGPQIILFFQKSTLLWSSRILLTTFQISSNGVLIYPSHCNWVYRLLAWMCERQAKHSDIKIVFKVSWVYVNNEIKSYPNKQ